MRRTFADRLHAGRVLAGHLTGRPLVDPVVLALPRGGVCVAHPVAEVLDAPLEVLVARKLGAPSQPELAFGAIAEGGPRVVDQATLAALAVPAAKLAKIEAAERTELERRVRRYRRDRPLPDLDGRDVVLVDDGLATGLTAHAALLALRSRRPRSVVLAVPVGPRSTVEELALLADEVVCLVQPEPFGSVGAWYDAFPPVADREVIRLLAHRAPAAGPPRRLGVARGTWVPPRRRRGADRQSAEGGQAVGH